MSCHGNRIFIAVGVFAVELLSCQFHWPALKIGQDSSINVIDIILG